MRRLPLELVGLPATTVAPSPNPLTSTSMGLGSSLGRVFHSNFELPLFRFRYLAVVLGSLDMRWLRFV